MPTSLKDCLTHEERVQFLKQEQIKKSQNFKPVGEQAEELERQAQEEIEINKIQPTPEQLTEWKRTGIINAFQGKILDFSKLTDRTGWNSKLIIKNCLELKYIDVSDLGLKTLNVINCRKLEELNGANNELENVVFRNLPKLETIYLNNNKLTTFYTSSLRLPNIKNLDVSANELKSLELKDCYKIEVLNCGNNKLFKLDLNGCKKLRTLLCYNNYFFFKNEVKVNHLDNLEYLACQNCGIAELDVSGLKELVELYCFGKKYDDNQPFIIIALKKINVGGCKKLEVLDIGEGLLEELILDDHSNLENVSVKQNSLERLVVNNCAKLDYLDYSTQGKWKEKNPPKKSFNYFPLHNKHNH